MIRSEVRAFREIFHIPDKDEANAARVFNLARQDVVGFDIYAKKIKAMFGTRTGTLEDLLEGLFHIAVSDGNFHENEDRFLRHVSEIFGLSERSFRVIKARFVKGSPADPYDVLGISHGASKNEIRMAWRKLVSENHPDQLMARGVPKEAITLAHPRMVAINQAWVELNSIQV